VLSGRLQEISLLPANNQQSLIDSAVTDLVCSSYEAGTITSLVDSKLATESLLWKWFNKTDALVSTGIVNRVANALYLDNNSKSLPDEARLSQLLKKLKISKEQKMPIGVFTQRNGEGSEPSYIQLSLRIPDVPVANEGAWQNLALLIKFACAITGADQSKVKVIADPSLGNVVNLPAFQQKLLNEISIAASHSQGLCTSEVYTIKGELKANPVEMLGILRVLNNDLHLCRRAPTRRGQTAMHLEPSEVREAYNQHCGLKTTSGGWVVQFITESLKFAVSTASRFPGAFVHAAKVRFGVKSNVALLHKMGWVPIIPAHVMANTVVYNKVFEKDGSKKLGRLKDDAELDYVEHRTMIALCLPKIDPRSTLGYDDQVRRDPHANAWGRPTIDVFRKREYVLLVDAINLAYNIHNSISDPKTRAAPVHFESVRNEVLKRSAFVPLIDASGKEYSKFGELPEVLKAYFSKKYHFTYGASKRSAPSGSQTAATADPSAPPPMEVDSSQTEAATAASVEGGASSLAPPSKKLKKATKPSFNDDHARVLRDDRVRDLPGSGVARSSGRLRDRLAGETPRTTHVPRGRGGRGARPRGGRV